MPDWMYRLYHSRTARTATLAGLAVVFAGSCAGAGIARYTVAGMNLAPYSGSEQFASADWREDEPEWVREAAMAATGDSDPGAGFASTSAEASYSDASY